MARVARPRAVAERRGQGRARIAPTSRGSADGRDHAHRVDRTVSNGSDRGRNRFGSGSVGAVPSPARIDLRSRSGGMVSQRPSIDVSILAHSPNSAGFAPIHVGEVSRMAACRGAVAASTSGLTGGGGRDSPNWRPPRGAGPCPCSRGPVMLLHRQTQRRRSLEVGGGALHELGVPMGGSGGQGVNGQAIAMRASVSRSWAARDMTSI